MGHFIYTGRYQPTQAMAALTVKQLLAVGQWKYQPSPLSHPIDTYSGLVHAVGGTTAKVAGTMMTEALLHGEETLVLGDGGYHRNNRQLDWLAPANGRSRILTPYKRKNGQALTEW